jgi:hypothetical protein
LRCTNEFPIVRTVEGSSPEPGVVAVGQSEISAALSGCESGTPAVGLRVCCSGEDESGPCYREFDLLMPPHAARALARHIVHQAATAERSGALEWVTGEIEASDGAGIGYGARLAARRRTAQRAGRAGVLRRVPVPAA